MRKSITILGSTGSIGENTLNIIKSKPELFRVTALVAKSNIEKLTGQIEKFRPKMVSVTDEAKAKKLRRIVGGKVKILSGVEGAVECAALDDGTLSSQPWLEPRGWRQRWRRSSPAKT